MSTDQEFNLATQLHQTGRLAEATAAYEKLLAKAPRHADALHYLGILMCQLGQPHRGAELIARAIALRSNVALYHNNLGTALKSCGKLNEAAAAYRRSIELSPRDPLAHSNLGDALRELGKPQESADACRRALALNGDYAEAHNNLGNALKDQGRLEEAANSYRHAARLMPNSAEIQNNLGSALIAMDQPNDAVPVFTRSLQLNPANARANLNLANAMSQLGKYIDAIAHYDKAVQLSPGLADGCAKSIINAHWELALTQLRHGDFEHGLTEYEWRLKAFTPRHQFAEPQWRGEPLEGRTILLHAEQGFGDTLQFVRYAPLVAARGGKVLLECQKELVDLMKAIPGVSAIFSDGSPLPGFDVQCPLLSLPLAFSTRLDSIPASVPYLSVEVARLEHWRNRLGPRDEKLRVAIAWAGRPEFPSDHTRSLHLSALKPLADVSGIRLYSLQKGSPAEQLKSPPPGLEIVDLGKELNDFADTAAVMFHMDLILSTDTSIPHLAGALGRPVWVMLRQVPDWRWLLHRDDSPWYPTMRLFRQETADDWANTIHRVAHALKELRAAPLKK